MRPFQLTDNFNITNDECHPLIVNATLSVELENNEWTWAVDRINLVEIQIGSKVGIDITSQVRRDARALALVTASVADCDSQIINSIAHSKTTAA